MDDFVDWLLNRGGWNIIHPQEDWKRYYPSTLSPLSYSCDIALSYSCDIESHHLSALEEKLKRGLNPNFMMKSGMTFLYYCVRNDRYLDRIYLLLRYGADVNRPNADHISRVMRYAVQDCKTIQLLLDHGADPNLVCAQTQIPTTLSPDRYPLDLCFNNEKRMLLLRHGAIKHSSRRLIIDQVLIVIDIMLYSSIQKDWCIEIKSRLY